MIDHGISATSWQLEAVAAGRLVIVLPLLPEPKLYQISPLEQFLYPDYRPYWQWPEEGTVVTWRDTFSPDLYKFLPYQEGDRIYLQEPWLESNDIDQYILFSQIIRGSHSDPEDIDDWQPVENMPSDAALYWFSVTGVWVCQGKKLSSYDTLNANLSTLKLVDGYDNLSSEEQDNKIQEHVDQVVQRWNSAHPEQPWDGDRWVVVLTVEQISEEKGDFW